MQIDIKNKIKLLGIKHYTNLEIAKIIIESKAIGVNPKGKTYFFINEPIPKDVLCYNLRFRKNDGGTPDPNPSFTSIAGKNTAVIVRNLTENQINSFKYKACNVALEYSGIFNFITGVNEISVEIADFKLYPNYYQSKMFKVIKCITECIYKKGVLDKLSL